MRILITHSSHDRHAVDRIRRRLSAEDFEILSAPQKGADISRRLRESLMAADAVIAVLSRASLMSERGIGEISLVAFGTTIRRQQRVIPVRLDDSPVPSYLADYVWLDMSHDFDAALESLVKSLHALEKEGRPQANARASSRVRSAARHDSLEGHVAVLSAELDDGRLTLVCGAGVSVAAGIPAWNDLLLRLLESMIERIAEDHPIALDEASLREFQRRHGSSSLIIGKYLKNNLGSDFLPQLRAALYLRQPTSCDLIEAIGELARPQRDGKPLDSIITFNFDSLIEENLDRQNVRNKSIDTEGVKHKSNELPVYHVHGYLPRGGRITSKTVVVFSEDAYHDQFTDPFSWSNLVQLTKLSQNTCLFVGVSLTDPNLRRLLDVSRRKNPDATHYMFKKTPSPASSSDAVSELAMFLEEQDANALGLNVLWVDSFDDIPGVIRQIADR